MMAIEDECSGQRGETRDLRLRPGGRCERASAFDPSDKGAVSLPGGKAPQAALDLGPRRLRERSRRVSWPCPCRAKADAHYRRMSPR